MKIISLSICLLALSACQTTQNKTIEPSKEKNTVELLDCPPKNENGESDYSNYSDKDLIQIMQNGCK